MPRVLLPTRWTQQPQGPVGIDWGNPISIGLTAAIIGNDAEILTRSIKTTFGTSPVNSVRTKGKCWDSSTAAGGQYYSVSDSRWTTSAQTHFMLAEITSSSGIWAGLIGSSKSDGSSGSLSIQRLGSGTNYSVFNSTTATAGFGDVTDIVNAGVKAICVTCVGTNSAAYLDGRYWGGGYLNNGVTTQSTGRLLSLSERAASTSYYHGGRVFVRLAWNRALSASEVASLSSNPWQIFAPSPSRLYMGVTGIQVDPRYARPSSDISTGAWTPSTGSTLYNCIDESTYSDADYILTSSASTCEIGLWPVQDPYSSSGQVLRFRAQSTSGSTLVATLKQGATTIATRTYTGVASSWTDYTMTLTSGECDSITDYSALSVTLAAS